MFDLLKKHIETELYNNIEGLINKNKISHNHPPLRKLVDGCEYCKKFGNIFVVN